MTLYYIFKDTLHTIPKELSLNIISNTYKVAEPQYILTK